MFSKRKLSTHALAGVLFSICFAVGTIRAQVTASVSGRVEDSSGAALPGATVTVSSLETGAGRTVSTGEEGTYRVLSLPVGRYEVRAELAGFKAALQTGVSLAIGEQGVVNLKLEVGAVQEQVTVIGEASVVNTTTASVSGLVGEREVKDLPRNGRSFDNLITLNPGAVYYSALKSGPSVGSGEGAYFAVAGRRPYYNLFLLNGIEYTGSSNIGITPGGVSGQLLCIDAVREFNVISDTYSAEYGKRSGGQVSVVTQSGTNQVHGSGFEFLRNSALDARNFFDRKTQPADPRLPPFRRNPNELYRSFQHSVCYPKCFSIRFCPSAAGRYRQASAAVLCAGDSGSLHHSIGDGSSSQREDSDGHFVELLHRAATEPQHVSSRRLRRLSRLPQHHR